ncbi:MAG: RimK family alpha-L-glutamate ligase [Roseburia sp.]|nr:RimK family alpha-L-glutamate ligase [Roseburia sp.]
MRKTKILILINAFAPTLETRQTARFCEEFRARGAEVEVKRNDFFPTAVEGGKATINIDCDACLFLDKDKYVSQLMEKRGVRLFNSARAIADCDDKMQTHMILADSGIPMPDTLPGLLCYDKTAAVPPEVFDAVEKKLGYPVIVKQSYGSCGKGVFKADDRKALIDIVESIKTTSHLYQRYVARSHGKDMRVIVVGGKVLGGILRMSDVDFRSNIGLGGKAVKTDVPPEIRDIALRVTDILGLDYCGIDFLLAENPLLCEVNSNAFFDAFEAATGINVAGAYAEHILKSIGKTARG